MKNKKPNRAKELAAFAELIVENRGEFIEGYETESHWCDIHGLKLSGLEITLRAEHSPPTELQKQTLEVKTGRRLVLSATKSFPTGWYAKREFPLPQIAVYVPGKWEDALFNVPIDPPYRGKRSQHPEPPQHSPAFMRTEPLPDTPPYSGSPWGNL